MITFDATSHAALLFAATIETATPQECADVLNDNPEIAERWQRVALEAARIYNVLPNSATASKILSQQNPYAELLLRQRDGDEMAKVLQSVVSLDLCHLEEANPTGYEHFDEIYEGNFPVTSWGGWQKDATRVLEKWKTPA